MSKKKRRNKNNELIQQRQFFRNRLEETKRTMLPKWESDMDSKMRELFKERWGDAAALKSKFPDLLSLSLSIDTSPQSPPPFCLAIKAILLINYHERYCYKEIEVQHLWDANLGPSREQFHEKCLELLDELAAAFPALVKSLPETYADTKEFSAIFSAIKEQIKEEQIDAKSELPFKTIVHHIGENLSEIEEEISLSMRKIAEKKLGNLNPLPPNAVVANPVTCKISLSNNGRYHINVFVAAYTDFPEISQHFKTSVSIATPNMFEKFFYDENNGQAAMKEAVRAAAESAVPQLMESFPVCRLPVETLPRFLADALSKNGTWYGKIHAVCENIACFRKAGICNYVGDGSIQLSTDSGESVYICLDDMQKAEAKSVKLRSKKGLPQNIVAFGQLCEAAGQLYESYSDKRVKVMPNLEFIFQDDAISLCRVRNETICIKDWFDNEIPHEKTIRSRLTEIFQKAADIEVEWQNKIASQIAVLGTLNPTEFEALRLIVNLGKCWYTEINDRLENSVLTTKVSMGPYLDHLCDTALKCGDKKICLLEFDWCSSRKHGDFRMYRSPVDWVNGIFNIAKPRKFTLNEIDDMTSNGKDTFFKMALKQGQDDAASRWSALNILERMSKQYAAEFVKTPKGESFFRSFEGDDALYAKFFIESLPGCKRLATKIFPDNN